MDWSSNEINPVDLVMEHRVLWKLFHWHRGRSRFGRVEVSVRGGIATITGHVRTFYDCQVVKTTASHVCGIHEIRDHLCVADCDQINLDKEGGLLRVEVPR